MSFMLLCMVWSAQSNKGKDPANGERTADPVCSVRQTARACAQNAVVPAGRGSLAD